MKNHRHRDTRCLGIELLEGRYLLAGIEMSVPEQIVIELINRARRDPSAEAARLGIDLNDGLPAGTLSPAARQPLAPHPRLIAAARAHSQDMIDRFFFDHVNPDGKNPRDRMVAAGFTPDRWGENIAEAFGTSHFHDILFESPGHRRNILDETFREIGVGLVPDFLLMGTEKFANRRDHYFVTGVAFSDQQVNDSFLSFGESLADVRITARARQSGTTYQTVTGPSGGYALQLPDGRYDVTAEGGGLAEPIVAADVGVHARNVKVDFVVPYVPPAVDLFEKNDTFAAAFELGYGDRTLEHLTIHEPENEDYFAWNALADGTLTVELDLQRDGGDLDLVLFDAHQNQLAASETSGPRESIVQNVKSGQRYFIVVRGYGGAIHRDYDLDIDGPGGRGTVPDVREANDSFDTAAEAGCGDVTLRGLTVHAPADRDFFEWHAAAAVDLAAQITFDSSAGSAQLVLYDDQRQFIARSPWTGNVRSLPSLPVSRGDMFYLLVEGDGRSILSDYTLTIGSRPSATDRTPPSADLAARHVKAETDELAFTVVYTDDVALDEQQLGNEDVRIQGPDGYDAHGELVSVDTSADSRTITAVYRIPPAEGRWDAGENGMYIVSIAKGIRDAAGNALAAGPLGSFMVAINGTTPIHWHNPVRPLDVTDDGNVFPADALHVINEMNAPSVHDANTGVLETRTALSPSHRYFDVSGDGKVTPNDVLRIVNFLNQSACLRTAGGEGERVAGARSPRADHEPLGWMERRVGTSTDPPRGGRSELIPLAGRGAAADAGRGAPRVRAAFPLGPSTPRLAPAADAVDTLLAFGVLSDLGPLGQLGPVA